jgi:ferredoxin
MPLVRFVSTDGTLLAEIEHVAPGALLLDLARDHQVPLHWRCGQGTCGTCRVHLQHVLQPRPWSPAGKERNVLLRAGLISSEQLAQDALIDQEKTWRLACHVRVEDLDLLVEVPPPV